MLSEVMARVAALKAAQLAKMNQSNPSNQSPNVPTQTRKEPTLNPTIETNNIIIDPMEALDIPDVSHVDISFLTPMLPFSLNPEQELAVKLAIEGHSFVLTGAAGTGKTTAMKAVFTALLHLNKLKKMNSSHKYLPTNAYGCVIGAFTRRATNNIKHALPPELQSNCITHHKLIEFAPVEEPGYDADGNMVMKKVFRPGRHQDYQLDENLSLLVFEESSMTSTELWDQIMDAIPDVNNIQTIILGDINQLGPVAGDAVLGYQLVKLPCVNLTRVYRQALESPIIRLAHRILSGKVISQADYPNLIEKGKLQITTLSPKIEDPEIAWQALSGIHSSKEAPTGLKAAYLSGAWNPATDAILLPFRKSPMGVMNFGKALATMLDSCQDTPPEVHEIITGKGDCYFAVGDKVLYEKEPYTIAKIVSNGNYAGVRQPRKGKFDRFGHEIGEVEIEAEFELSPEESAAAVAASWENYINGDAETKRAASHRITLQSEDGESEIELDSSGQVNKLAFAYAITGHESQGLEFSKVFIFLTKETLRNFVSREWLYTAVTRAKESLIIACAPEALVKGIVRQQIPGSTLAAKRKHFQQKIIRKAQESTTNLRNLQDSDLE